MRLVYIHGPPASGKLTVAKALREKLPSANLLENHAAIDFARNVMDLSQPGFWELVFAVREHALSAAAIHNVPLLIATACFTDPGDIRWLEDYTVLLTATQSELLPVWLECPTEELERRLGSPERVARGKLTDVDAFRAFMDGGRIVPVPQPNLMRIDTTSTSPEEAAASIVAHFSLDQPEFPKDGR